jgi:hypothetical protein
METGVLVGIFASPEHCHTGNFGRNIDNPYVVIGLFSPS